MHAKLEWAKSKSVHGCLQAGVRGVGRTEKDPTGTFREAGNTSYFARNVIYVGIYVQIHERHT